MSSIDSITGSSSAATTAATASNQLTGSKDEFLKLFMAQLQNQDPLDPKSGSDMVAQLAQFSSVEQATQTNSSLADLVAGQASTSTANMANLVGRTCDANATDFSIDPTKGGAPPPLDVSATGPMKGASIVITDATGKEIRRIPIPDGATSATLAWDGKTSAGATAPAGAYKISVDQGSTASSITARWQGRVDAVELTADGPRLRMGDVLVAPATISTIGASS